MSKMLFENLKCYVQRGSKVSEMLKNGKHCCPQTLKWAQNENQPSVDNCAGRSYPLTAMSFFITFKSFMVKKISLCLCASAVNACQK